MYDSSMRLLMHGTARVRTSIDRILFKVSESVYRKLARLL